MEGMMNIDPSLREADLLSRSRDRPKGNEERNGSTLNVRQSRNGVDVISDRYEDQSIYIGEDEKDTDITDFSEATENLNGDEHYEDETNLPLDECLDLWRPWRRAIIIIVLWRRFSYALMSQKLNYLWKLQGHLELTDLDNDFYVVRFTMKEENITSIKI